MRPSQKTILALSLLFAAVCFGQSTKMGPITVVGDATATRVVTDSILSPSFLGKRSLNTLYTVQSRNLETEKGYFQDGSGALWDAGQSYASVFLFDFSQAVFGWPEYFSSSDIMGITKRYTHQPNGGGQFAIQVNNSGAVGTYYSGSDNGHHHATGEATFIAPLLYKLAYQKSGSLADFNADSAALKTALLAIPLNGSTHLVTVVAGDDWVPWGFQEVARFTGDVTTGSVMMWQACTTMAAMYTAAGDATNANLFTGMANNIAASLTALSPLWDSVDGMFYAATINNKQVDVLGSALAVSSGLTTGVQATAISNYLVAHYGSLTKNGYYRQSSGDWAITGSIPVSGTIYGTPTCSGCYQNGYWSVGNRWILDAMALTSKPTAILYANDFIAGPDYTQEYYVALPSAGSGSTGMIEAPGGVLSFIRNNLSLFTTEDTGTFGQLVCQSGSGGLLPCTTATTRYLQLANEGGGTFARLGQITAANPKQLAIGGNTAANVIDIQAWQLGLANPYTQILRLNPFGGPLLVGGSGGSTIQAAIPPPLSVSNEGTGDVAAFGQITTATPFQMVFTSIPALKFFELQTVTTNVAYEGSMFLQPQGGNVILGTSSAPVVAGVRLNVALESGGSIAAFGQITTANPKQLVLVGTPGSNLLDIQGVQSGVGYNQTVRINPSGGNVELGGGVGATIKLGAGGSGIVGDFKGSGTLTYSAIGANACQEQPLTITGAVTADACFASPASDPGAGFSYGGCRISGSNTAQIRVCSGAGGTPSSVSWTGWARH